MRLILQKNLLLEPKFLFRSNLGTFSGIPGQVSDFALATASGSLVESRVGG